MTIRLQSINFTEFFIRHQNFGAELMKVEFPGFREDFLWNEVFRGRDSDGVARWSGGNEKNSATFSSDASFLRVEV